MVNEFHGMKGELGKVEWSDHIPLPTSEMETWRILLWTKAFQLLFRGTHKYTMSTTIFH